MSQSGLGELRLLLDARETAEALSICQKALWSITEPRGDLPVVRIGWWVLNDPRDLGRWISDRKGDRAP